MKTVRKLVPLMALSLLLGGLFANYVDAATSADSNPSPCSRDCGSGIAPLSSAIFGRAV